MRFKMMLADINSTQSDLLASDFLEMCISRPHTTAKTGCLESYAKCSTSLVWKYMLVIRICVSFLTGGRKGVHANLGATADIVMMLRELLKDVVLRWVQHIRHLFLMYTYYIDVIEDTAQALDRAATSA